MSFDISTAKPVNIEKNNSKFDMSKAKPISILNNSETNDPLLNNSENKHPILNKIVNSETLPIAGAVIGGIVGNAPGAALGGSTGEAFKQLGQRYLGENFPQTSDEALKNILLQGAAQGTMEAVTGPALNAIGKGINAIPGVKTAITGVGNVAKKTGGDLLYLLTKVKPEYAKTLFENPEGLLPGMMAKAKAAWRSAAQAAGLPVDEVSPELIDLLKTNAKETVYNTFTKIKGGEFVAPADTELAKQALDIALMPAAKTEKNAPLVAIYSKIRKTFSDKLSDENAALAAANEDYFIAKAGEKFKTLLPQNLNNTPAFLRASSLPITGFMLDKENRGAGALTGLLLSSPIAFGTGIATAGAISPYVGGILKSIIADALANKIKNGGENK